MGGRPLQKRPAEGGKSFYLVAGVAFLLAGIGAAAGYAIYRADQPRPFGTTTITGGTSRLELGIDPTRYADVNAAAHTRLAATRCDREQACQSIGAGKRYADHEACVADLRLQGSVMLPEARCQNGVAPAKVDACAAAIHDTSCSDPLLTLDGIEACRAHVLCENP
jgi:hypothetical protein